jgi:hypothetical protein
MISKIKLLKFFLVPVFGRNGYEIEKNNRLCFVQKKNRNISVDYEVLPINGLEITVRHPKLDDSIKFPELVDGPEKVYWNGGAWMGFDTIDELLGLIEYQAECFEKWIFDFLAGKAHEDIFDRINNQRKTGVEEYSKMIQEEKEKILTLYKRRADEIFSRRFLPQKWTLELFESRNK